MGGRGGWREGVGGWGVCTPMDVRVASETDVLRLRRYVTVLRRLVPSETAGVGVTVSQSHMAVLGGDRVVVGVQL